MKTRNGFTKFDNMKEFDTWLSNQKVSRTVNRLQVHHMDLPSYSTWENTDKKVFGSEPELGRTDSLDDYGKRTWGSDASDGHGHYIAQHFNIFPNGKITTGRNLNSTPIGIKGWNTNAICVEIYGDFDKGKDTMTIAQKEAVIGIYALLCKKFKITPSTDTIRYHGWFTSGGTYLGSYDSNKSAKTCPGTGFFGGNSSSKMKENFLPLIKSYDTKNLKMSGSSTTAVPTVKKVNYTVQVICDVLNIRKEADFDSAKIGELKKNTKADISKECNGLGYVEDIKGWISLNKNYVKKIDNVVKDDTIKIVRNISGEPLNLRETADWNAKSCGTMKPDDVLTYVKTVDAKNGSTKMYLTKAGTYVTASDKYTKLDTIKK